MNTESNNLPKVAIVYLSYFSMPYLEEVFSCFDKLDYPRDRLEIIVVDNASTDGSVEWLSKRTDITFFPCNTNPGFSEGNNLGIRHALLHGADYIFLHNNDLKLDPSAIRESVLLAESNPKIGSVQSFVKLWQDPEIINVTGGMVHFLGFGYARDNGKKVSEVSCIDGEEIAYSSGAAVLFRSSALQSVGLLEPFFFMYHEDLELGWRLRLNGFKNVLSTKSIAFHKYVFKKSYSKFYWMERNRFIVHLIHLKWKTILLLIPFWIIMEIAMLAFAIKGKWIKEKLFAIVNLMSLKTIRHIIKSRRVSKTLRTVGDREIVRLFVSKIESQETSSFVVDKIGNPLLTIVWWCLRKIIVW